MCVSRCIKRHCHKFCRLFKEQVRKAEYNMWKVVPGERRSGQQQSALVDRVQTQDSVGTGGPPYL